MITGSLKKKKKKKGGCSVIRACSLIRSNTVLTKDRLKQIPTYLQLQTQSLTYFYSFIAALE